MMKFLSLSLLAAAMMSGARAAMQMVKGGDMCAGYDDATDDFKVYYGPCVSADTVATTETTPYFTAETQDMALISGGDSAYLTDTSKISEIDATGTYSNALANQDGGGGAKYAYVIGQATASAGGGQDATGDFGTAFYMVTEGTVTTNKNTFPKNNDGSGSIDVCISQITGGACGAARSWSAGHLKYTLFGSIHGDDISTTLAGKDYLGVRQHVTIQRSDAVTVTFNDGIALDAIGGADVTSFKIVFGGDKIVTHTFPTKYNVGSTADCTGTATALDCPTTAGNSFTRDVKIKVSDDGISGTMGVYFDYLFALAPSATGVNDGLNTGGRYFVYDPDVTAGTTTTTTTGTTTTGTTTTDTTSPKASGATTTFNGVVLAALAAAMFFQG